MNFKLKQLCIILCGVSILNYTYAATTNVSTQAATTGKTPQTTTPSPAPKTSDDKVVLNFENADIQSVIKAISKLSGKNFVIDPRVKGTVNIVSEKPISKAESYKVLESALRMQGFATVEADGVIKVLPETDARTYGMRTETQTSKRNPGDQLVTKIFIIENGSATQLSNALRPMISPNNSISVYSNSNAIIITDYSSNMARITKIVNDLQVTRATRIAPVTIKLKYAYAGDVAQTLQSYMGNASGGSGNSGGNGSDGPTAIITVDANTNAIIISSNVASKLEDLKNLALSLDKDTSITNNNLHVVYLRNADAAHVAEVLRVIATGQDNPDLMPSSANRALSDTSSAFQSSSGGGSSGGSGGSSGGFNGGSSSQQNRSSQSSSRGSGSGGSNSNDKNAPKILIQAEPTTNALIIQAPEAAYRNLRMVINMLDVRRVQVMLEALIADVNTSDSGTFGIQWVGGAGNNSVGAGVLSNYGGSSSIGNIATTAMGAAGAAGGSGGAAAGASALSSLPGEVYVGLVTGTVNIGGTTIPGISALADMIAANTAGNILGRPTLLTLDNEEASIFVGQNIGIPSGSYATTGGNSTVNPFTTVNRQDVGTVLRLKPLVTQSGAIQLSVYQEDSLVDAGTPAATAAANGPNILKRNLKTQILVNDGQIIALGGMTSDQIQLTSNGIPFLSSIPYLGWLFSWQSRSHTKQNRVIFLRPVIIRNAEGINALTNQRYRYVMDQQNSVQAKGNALLPQINAVNLDNQVPYNNAVPNQNVQPPASPIVDLRGGVPASTSSNTSGQQQQPLNTGGSGLMMNQTSTNGNTVIKQTAPNSISIIDNN